MADKTHYHVFFLDVGQGEATLIVKREISNNGDVTCTTLLVDTDKCTSSSGTIDTVQLVKDSIPKITKDGKDVHFLNGMVITHPHDDHIGGLDSFVNDADISVAKIFHPDYDFIKARETADYKAYDKLRKDSSKQNETRLIAGNDYGNDTGIKFSALSPPKSIEDADKFKEQDECIQVHNQSAVISIDMNGKKILFLGDGNKECMKRLMKNYSDKLPAFILSASHHGSNSLFVPEKDVEDKLADIKRGDKDSEWDEEFLATIDPDYVVISCGTDNKYKHPHSAALETYEDAGRVVRRTDEHSTVYFVIDEYGACDKPTYLSTYDAVKKQVKSLFPSNAKEESSVKPFFVSGAAIPVPPRNA